MEPITPSEIVDAFENAGFETRSYSGRCMYGDECLDVECDEPEAVLLQVVAAYVEFAESPEVLDFIQALGTPKTDSMGRSSILYFPRVKWTRAEAESKEEGDFAGAQALMDRDPS